MNTAPDDSTPTCRWTGRETPRVLGRRHLSDCTGDCTGCQPCDRAHCRVCGRTHAAGTCPGCLEETREALVEIGRMCGALPEEVESRGVEGEAMNLLGNSADPEAWGHHEASVRAGRIPQDWFEIASSDLHPLWVLGTWDMVWRDALEHEEPEGRLSIGTAVAYLLTTMGYMSSFEHVPFEDFARDVRACAAHLEAVLHDGEQVDRGAPCLQCGTILQRKWGRAEALDGWECPRCQDFLSERQYRAVVAEAHLARATELTDQQAAARTGLRAGTIRVWAARGLVRSRRVEGRMLYSMADVMERVASVDGAADAV